MHTHLQTCDVLNQGATVHFSSAGLTGLSPSTRGNYALERVQRPATRLLLELMDLMSPSDVHMLLFNYVCLLYCVQVCQTDSYSYNND